MTCVVTTEGGTTVIACSRQPWSTTIGGPKCDRCGRRPALFECDFPDPSHTSGTCDRKLCSHRDCLATRWAKQNRERLDVCRAHVETKVAA